MKEKNNNLTPEERLRLRTEEGVYAAVMGYLKSERGKIAPSVFNKIVHKNLNYPRMTKDELLEFGRQIESDDILANIYSKAYNRMIKLDDLPEYNDIGGEVEEVDDSEFEYPVAEENIFEKVTNFLIDNEDNNAKLRELRKLQREGVYQRILMDNLKKYLKEELGGMPRAKYLQTRPIPQGEKERALILLVSDWHIGALVYNESTGGYNFKKLLHMTQGMVDKVAELVHTYNLNKVYMFFVGDIIEHISMRNVNQAFEAEFPATHQIAKATRLITDMLSTLSKQVHVTFGMVAGNHDRFEGNKNDKVYNDNAAYIIIDTLFLLQKDFGQLPNVTLIDNREDTYQFHVTVAGKRILVRHGDQEKKKDEVKITKHIKDEPIDYYIMGHIHTTRVVQEDYHRFHVYVGSTMGANNYVKELNLPTTNASQMIMMLSEGSKSPLFMPLIFDKDGNL